MRNGASKILTVFLIVLAMMITCGAIYWIVRTFVLLPMAELLMWLLLGLS